MGGVDATKRVEAGEAFDVVILSANAIDKLIDSGKILPNSRIDLVKSGVAIAVKEGAQIMDVSSEETVKQAVLAANTIAYSTGPSGVYLTEVFEHWGIAEQIKDRIVKVPPGVPVGSLVAKGEVELGFLQLSELLHLKGIIILGPLPTDIQIMTHFQQGSPLKPISKKPLRYYWTSLHRLRLQRLKSRMAWSRSERKIELSTSVLLFTRFAMSAVASSAVAITFNTTTYNDVVLAIKRLVVPVFAVTTCFTIRPQATLWG